MEKPTIVGLYGLPGCGKTYTKDHVASFLKDEEFVLFDGSAVIDKIVPGGLEAFKAVTDQEKHSWRVAAIAAVQKECRQSGRTGVVTGHCMFWQEDAPEGEWIVTAKDWEIYSHIIYLDVPAETILERRQNDTRRRESVSVFHIRRWQEVEKIRLRKECYERGVLFSILTTSNQSNNQGALTSHLHDMLRDIHQYSVATNQTHAEACLAGLKNFKNMERMMVFDGDRTLTVEDTGTLFWKAVAALEKTPWAKEDPHKAVFQGPQKYSHIAFRQAVLLYEDAVFRLGPITLEAIIDEVAQAVTFRPEFKILMNLVDPNKGIGAVVVTCGNRLIWERVLKKAGVSDTVKVIGGGTFGTGYVVTPGVKGAVAASLRDQFKYHTWVFGDGVVDLHMLRGADEAVVVVGEENARSKTMDTKLPELIAARWQKPRQLLLPGTVLPRLDTESLPPVTISELEQEITSPYMPLLQHATGKGAARLLMTHTRDPSNSGPRLQQAHYLVGRYLAMEYLSTAIGLETFSMGHVQAGKSTEGWKFLNEDKTLIIAVMRGGLPMAEGVNDILPRASILHTKHAADIPREHLEFCSAIIIVDGVINNGATVEEFVQFIRASLPTVPIIVMADVVQEKSVSKGGKVYEIARQYGRVKVVALRLSKNQYTGSGTTDTGNRLFNTTFLQK